MSAKCPKCGGSSFSDQRQSFGGFNYIIVYCSNSKCNAAIGVTPANDVLMQLRK